MHLVINSYGATLQKNNNLLVVATAEGSQSFPPDVIRSISINKGTRITSDAILLAIKHQVEILFVDDLRHCSIPA